MNSDFRKSTLLTLILIVCLTACSDEYSDMSTSFRSELCVVKSSAGKSIHLLTDKGRVLNPVAELDTSQYKPGNRYMVTYIMLDSTSMSSLNSVSGSYSIRVKDLQSVLIKPILRADQLTSPVTIDDPVKLLSQPWLGGGFLNMELMLKYENTNIKHSLWMLVDTTIVEHGSLNTYLTFIHTANGDRQTTDASTLVSFDCSNLSNQEEPDSLIIRVQEWDLNNHLIQKQYRLLNTTKRRLTFPRI